MKLYLLGATGRVGQKILEKALADQHDVTILVRSTEKAVIQSDLLTVWEGNALKQEDLINSMAGSDVVLSALNTDQNQTLSRSMPLILNAMNQHSISRIITIGTAGILDSRTEPHLYRFQSSESKRRTSTAAQDHLAAYELLAASSLAWTVVCPTYLPDGEGEGQYRTQINVLPQNGSRISVGDTAGFAYSLLSAKSFFHKRIGIAY